MCLFWRSEFFYIFHLPCFLWYFHPCTPSFRILIPYFWRFCFFFDPHSDKESTSILTCPETYQNTRIIQKGAFLSFFIFFCFYVRMLKNAKSQIWSQNGKYEYYIIYKGTKLLYNVSLLFYSVCEYRGILTNANICNIGYIMQNIPKIVIPRQNEYDIILCHSILSIWCPNDFSHFSHIYSICNIQIYKNQKNRNTITKPQ